MLWRWALVALLAGLTLGGTAPAAAQEKPLSKKEATARASQLVAQGKAAFQEKRYDEAADLFMAAFKLANNPAAVYNAARAKELAGKLSEAKAYFEIYLQFEKGEAGRADAARRLIEIDAALRRQAEDKAKAEAAATAKARDEALMRERAEQASRDAEAKIKAAEAKVREAELRAQQEAAARHEAEQRARAEAEARGRAEAEVKAKNAEQRANNAEAKLRDAENRSRAVAPGEGPRPPERPLPTPPEPEPPGLNLVYGVVLAADGGAHIEESAPDGNLRPDFILGLAATGHVGLGRGRTPYVSLLAGMRLFGYAGFDAHAEPKQTPSGTSYSLGLALPRLGGLQAFVQRHFATMAAGAGDFDFTTVGMRIAVAQRTGYVALGFEGLVGSSRRGLDIVQTDEVGYGPTARLFLELGVNLANCGLSR